MRDTAVVEQRGIERVRQREVTERVAVERVDAGDAARDVAAADEQHEHEVHAVAVNALRGWTSFFAGPCFDSELVRFNAPVARGGLQAFPTCAWR